MNKKQKKYLFIKTVGEIEKLRDLCLMDRVDCWC